MRINGRNHLAWAMSATLSFSLAATVGIADDKSKDRDPADSVKTESPIKHVIILIGENRGTDHTFGVYKPKV
jgi:phospholipase C